MPITETNCKKELLINLIDKNLIKKDQTILCVTIITRMSWRPSYRMIHGVYQKHTEDKLFMESNCQKFEQPFELIEDIKVVTPKEAANMLNSLFN